MSDFGKEFKYYVETVWPGQELHPQQTEDLKRTFYAGAGIAINQIIDCADNAKDDIEVIQKMQEMGVDIWGTLKKLIDKDLRR